jgi:hexosaminidase
MNKSLVTVLLLGATWLTQLAPAATPAIVPAPVKMEPGQGTFKLTAATRIGTDAASRATGEYLAERLRKATGYPLELVTGKPDGAGILITTADANAALGDEGYELTVTPTSVVIRAPKPAGAFYGVQSLLQLLPPQVFAASPATGVSWEMPAVQIQDQPRFKWRGLMLDVARHFYSKAEVKRYLDNMALHKMNNFHWHLVDDQGWRIAIKKYPKLTEVGAWRSAIGFGLKKEDAIAYGPDGRYGGFYTQDDIREVVAYAAKLHITVVPEIEMPGHAVAALASYPQFSCSGNPYSTDISAGVNRGIYCPSRPETYAFLQDILTEVMALFPGQYIHIGGDEVPKENWKKCERCQAFIKSQNLKNEHELQSYFVQRMEKFIAANGRHLIGWSEISEGGLAQGAAIMDWIGGGAEAAAAGHDVVMSPARPVDYSYFDHYQSQDKQHEPKSIGGYLPLERVYAMEPIPAKLDPALQHHVLGAQGNLWTEYIANAAYLDYMTYPRACAMAEVTWSPKEARNWDDFNRRLQTHLQRLDIVGVKYRPLTPATK